MKRNEKFPGLQLGRAIECLDFSSIAPLKLEVSSSIVKILVVDDHILFREGLVSLLSNKDGLSVVGEAGSVREAIEKTTQLDPDLVLMDISLPDGSGLDAMKSILSNNPKILFVILTPQESDKLLFESIRHGAVGFILKNTPASKLIESLHAIRRGEAALSRRMTRKVLGEFQRVGMFYTPDNTDLSILSERELQVLAFLAGRATNQEIANSLFIAVNTVKVHVHNILSKLELTNRREAGEFARNHNINPPT
jgi:DNA-binding NarL/FixJ family response regulator